MTIQEELIIEMTVGSKMKRIKEKLEQNKNQYNLDRPTAAICALSSENVSKYESSTRKNVFYLKKIC